jgi:hypothetical protein
MNFGDIPSLTAISSGQSLRLNSTGTGFEAFTPSSSGQTSIQFKDDGTNRGAAGAVASVDFTGAGVSATISGSALSVSIPGGAGEAFPVGAVFLSVVSTNPASLLGYGTWSQIAQGNMLVGFSSGDSDFGTVEASGGTKTHTIATANLPAHNHPVTDPGHTHLVEAFPTATGGLTGFTRDTSMSGTPANTSQSTASATTGITVGNTGSGTAVNHLNPFFVVYVWKRTA